MEFRILGPLEVVDGDATIDLGPHRQRSLLALLLLHANRVVSTDRILDELWGEDAEGKERALWIHMSRLRSALEPGRDGRGSSSLLLTRDHGYVLTVEPASIDARSFEALLEDGRASIDDVPEAASDTLRRALGLWRGAALQDFTYEHFAGPEIARLESLRLDAIEARVDADLRRGLSSELVTELETLVAEHPERERPVGQLMLALYRSGRQGEALRAFQRHRRQLSDELGLEPAPELRRLEEQILLHDRRLLPPATASSRAMADAAVTNPFKGLQAFAESDAEYFFGRDTLVSEVLARIHRGDRLLALVGPSGSGKSSVVHAGVVPALRKATNKGGSWAVASMVPGSHPFVELEVALLRSTIDPPPSLTEQLQQPATGVLHAALRVLPREDTRMLLVIDQFEELFTLADPSTCERFLTNLVTVIDDPHERVTVVITLRADAYQRPLAHPAFGKRLGAGVVNVVPLNPDELEEAAQQPAARRGVTLEPRLVAELLVDVVGEPGALPTFEYALTELFDRRKGDRLTADTYHAMGGVRGALRRRADDLYSQLSEDERLAARQLFLRLVTVGEHDEWSRRRVQATEILALDVDVVTMSAVIDRFGRHRFLAFDRDPATGAPTVEVAHETLLHEWPQLRGWIEESRDDLRRHAALTVAMAEWERAGREPDYLLAGARQAEYERWSTTATLQLTSAETEFLDAARDHEVAERRREASRSAQEAQLGRRARRRLWGLVAALAALALVALVVFVVTRPESRPRVAIPFVSAGDRSVNDLVASGFARAEQSLDFEAAEATLGVFSDVGEYLTDLADQGTDLFIVTAGLFNEPAAAVAAAHPDTSWVYVDTPVAGSPSVIFADHEAAFLVGAAAASTSETGTIGFVGGFQNTVVERFRAGYEAGARAADPDVQVLASYVALGYDGFGDVEMARSLSDSMYDRGADVIFGAAGAAGFGVIEAAAAYSEQHDTHVWAIGADADQYLDVAGRLRPYVLTSTLKKYDTVVVDVIEDYLDGGLDPVTKVLDLADGAVDISTSGDALSPETLAVVERLRQEVISGRRVAPLAPSGALDPPPAVDAVTPITIRFDGTTCAYDGPADLGSGVVKVTFVNQTPVDAMLAVGGGDGLPDVLNVPAAPNSENAGYAALLFNTHPLTCHAGADAAAPAVAGAVLAPTSG